MFREKSEIQKLGIIVCSIFIIGALIFGIVARATYSRMSQNESNINHAAVTFDRDTAEYTDYEIQHLSFDLLKQDLDSYDYIFAGKILNTEYCFNCIKYTVKITQSIKGDEKTGNTVILYKWGGIDKFGDQLIYDSFDGTMPLWSNKEYLLFSQKREYDPLYQETLDYNEYSLGLKNYLAVAFVINETQKDYIDFSTTMEYEDLKEIYYTCFSQEALNNVNKVAKQITDYYME